MQSKKNVNYLQFSIQVWRRIFTNQHGHPHVTAYKPGAFHRTSTWEQELIRLQPALLEKHEDPGPAEISYKILAGFSRFKIPESLDGCMQSSEAQNPTA